MALYMSLDNGMGVNKLYFIYNGIEHKIEFASRVKELKIETADSMYINNKLCSFAEGAIAAELGHPAKDNEVHKLLLNKAMYEAYKITKETEFDIVTNCSLDSYKQDSGSSVKNKMLEDKEITIREIFKDEVILNIGKLVCLPECLSGGLMAPLKLKDEDVLVVDIGTKNFQLIQVVEGVPKYEQSFATLLGMDQMYKGISNVVKAFNPKLRSAESIKKYLKDTASGAMEPIQDVDDAILNYLVNYIFVELDSRMQYMDLSMFTKIVFIGGGSIYLKRFLETKFVDFERIYVDDPFFANAKGLYNRGLRLLGHTKPEIKPVEENKEAKPKTTTRKRTTKKSTSDTAKNKSTDSKPENNNEQ